AVGEEARRLVMLPDGGVGEVSELAVGVKGRLLGVLVEGPRAVQPLLKVLDHGAFGTQLEDGEHRLPPGEQSAETAHLSGLLATAAPENKRPNEQAQPRAASAAGGPSAGAPC